MCCLDDRLLVYSCQLTWLERCTEINTIVESLGHVELVKHAKTLRFANKSFYRGPNRFKLILFNLFLQVVSLLYDIANELQLLFSLFFESGVVLGRAFG